MPRLIFKCPYIRGGGGRAASHLNNYVSYMATRPGVERIEEDRWPATKKQREMVQMLAGEFPLSKGMREYRDYQVSPTRANASAFISQALEENWDEMAKKENYLQYIAHRPRVQMVGTHGLFTGTGEPLVLSKVAAEVAKHSGKDSFVVLADMQRMLAHGVHVGGDAAGHAPQELLGLAHSVLLPLPPLQQRAQEDLLLPLAEMHHPAASVLLHAVYLHIPGMRRVVAVERLGDGGGGQEHPVQVVPVLSQGLAGEETLGDGGPALLGPFEVGVQIDALAVAVVHGAEDVRVPGNLPAILPVLVQQEVFVREIPHALQPVSQFLKHLRRRPLSGIELLCRIVGVRRPVVKKYRVHVCFSSFRFYFCVHSPSKQPQGIFVSGNRWHIDSWSLSASTKSLQDQSRPSPLTDSRLGLALSSMAMALS